MPNKLSVEILKRNASARLADADHLRDGLVFVRQILQQKTTVNEVEGRRRKRQRSSIAGLQPGICRQRAGRQRAGQRFEALGARVDSRDFRRWVSERKG